MHYFDRLQHDMQQLGVTSEDSAPQTYRQLVHLADTASGKENFDIEVVKAIDPEALQTNFARYALHLFHNDPLLADAPEVIRNKKTYGICDMAEYRIATTLRATALRNDAIASPAIVTDNDEPAGILQRSRNARRMIYYALENNETLQTSMGCVYQIQLPHVAFSEPLKSNHAWKMPVDELVGTVDNGRMSIFTVPPTERGRLDVDDAIETPGLQRSHRALVGQAAMVLDWAQPLSVKPSYANLVTDENTGN